MGEGVVRKGRGRPPLNEARRRQVLLRLTEEEYRQVRKMAEEEKSDVSGAIRRRIFREAELALDEQFLNDDGREFLRLARAGRWSGFRLRTGRSPRGWVGPNIEETSLPIVRLVPETGVMKAGEFGEEKSITLESYVGAVRRGKMKLEEAVNCAGEDLREILSEGKYRAA
jgi:hypothetical protein